MKPQLRYLIFADDAIIEEGTGKMSIIGAFNEVNIPKDKESVILPKMVLVASIYNTKDVKNLEVEIVGPKGNAIGSLKIDQSLEEQKDKLMLRAIFGMLTFKDIGNYRARILLNNESIECNEYDYFEAKKNG